jgi:predicted NBD/HSP70 family sugar kinase
VLTAAHGDPDAGRVVRDAAEALGGGVGFLVNVLDLEAVVVGDGLGLAGGPDWDAFTDSVRLFRRMAERDPVVVQRGLPSDASPEPCRELQETRWDSWNLCDPACIISKVCDQ